MIGSNQGTVAGTIHLHGVGVHSGKEASLEIKPSEADTGVRFRRIDLPDSPEVPADLDHVADTELGTSLACDDVRVLTVEHVLAVLAATGVSNALIELDGPEPPILDGSFLPYVEAIETAGVVRQDGEVPVVRVQRPISVDDGKGSSYLVAPARSGELRISATIDFAHPAIGRQYGSFDVNEANFRGQLAPARTFGFRKEAEALRERGLARGSSLENTIVLDDEGVVNDGLRFPDECLRHKVGDIVGDLALLGCRVEAHVVADRPSHHGNVALARAVEEARRQGEGEGIPIVDIQKILQYLPHRYPMLLVDRVTHFESGKRIVGIKNVTINEPFFQGHYPGHPIMPGVLIIEAMAQVGGLLLMDTIESPEDKVVYFMSLDKVKWRRPVTPGDQVVFRVELVQLRRSICRMRGEGFVDGKLVAEAELMARMVDR